MRSVKSIVAEVAEPPVGLRALVLDLDGLLIDSEILELAGSR